MAVAATDPGDAPFDLSTVDTIAAHARDSIESTAFRISPEMMRLQLQAIDTIHDSILAVLRIARSVGSSAGRPVNGFSCYSGQVGAALQEATSDFFRAALGLMGASGMTGLGGGARFAADGAMTRAQFHARIARLTAQQRRVLNLVQEGLANKMIAYRLGVRESTIKAHVSKILHTLDTPSRARAIVMVARFGETNGEP